MHIAGRMLFRGMVLAVAVLLAACATSVALHDNKKLLATPYKLSSVQLAYQTPNWLQGLPNNDNGTNGFAIFGTRVVKSAQTFLPAQGLELVSADVVRVGGSIVVSRQPSEDPVRAFAVLRIAPVKGQIRTGTTTRRGSYESSSLAADYEFRVELVDVGSRKTVWQATLDTHTMTASSKDSPKNEGGFYDDVMAQRVLETIVGKMKEDGLI
jgi:hypothetical protein